MTAQLEILSAEQAEALAIAIANIPPVHFRAFAT
jgi:hypothetical protein